MVSPQRAKARNDAERKALDAAQELTEISEYLASKKIYEQFDFFVKELTAAKPENPIQFLIKLLERTSTSTLLRELLMQSQRK